MSGPTPFVAIRRDGFGERLRAILNAMVFAEVFHSDFRFTWDVRDDLSVEHHAIRAAETVFERSFADRHCVASVDPGRSVEMLSFRDRLEDLPGVVAAGEHAAIIVHQHLLSSYFKGVSDTLPAGAFGRKFGEIRFTPALEAARAAALETDFPGGAVAVHLRAGDVIYGRFRFHDQHTTKAMPLPLAIHALQSAQAAGRDAVVFGQDAALCRYLADTHGAILADDLAASRGFDPVERVVFDITLMARCVCVHGGRSGFATVSSLIGGSRHIQPHRAMKAAQLAELTLSCPDLLTADPGVHALQRSFAYWFAALHGLDVLPSASLLRLIDAARSHDEENFMYLLARAAVLARDGALDDAEAALRSLLELEADEPRDPERPRLTAFLRTREGGGRLVLAKYVEALAPLLDAGKPCASLVAAAFESARGNVEKGRDLLASAPHLPRLGKVRARIARAVA